MPKTDCFKGYTFQLRGHTLQFCRFRGYRLGLRARFAGFGLQGIGLSGGKVGGMRILLIAVMATE